MAAFPTQPPKSGPARIHPNAAVLIRPAARLQPNNSRPGATKLTHPPKFFIHTPLRLPYPRPCPFCGNAGHDGDLRGWDDVGGRARTWGKTVDRDRPAKGVAECEAGSFGNAALRLNLRPDRDGGRPPVTARRKARIHQEDGHLPAGPGKSVGGARGSRRVYHTRKARPSRPASRSLTMARPANGAWQR